MLINELGTWISRTRYEDLPPGTIQTAKMRILDLITATVVGFRIGVYRPLYDILGGHGEATVWCEGTKYPLRDAVLLNSFMAHSTYLEDGSRFTGGHPSSVVIPAVLTTGETRRASGKAILLSVILGYEIFVRLGQAIYPATVKRGFQSTAVLGAVSAAAGCATLFHYDPARCAHALAIACNQGVGLKDALKSPASQPLQVGRSCEGGVLAALLAGKGVEGSDTILENGFLKAFADHPSEEGILAGFGREYAIDKTYLKIHGGCRGNHAPIDGVLSIMRREGITAKEIREIHLKVDTVTLAASLSDPRDGGQGQISIPFAVAVAVIEGNSHICHYTDNKVHDPVVRSVMSRISVEADRTLDRGYPDQRGARVRIILRDGSERSASIDIARGEPECPLENREVEEKFLFHTEDMLGKKAEEVMDMVRHLDELQEINPLIDIISIGREWGGCSHA